MGDEDLLETLPCEHTFDFYKTCTKCGLWLSQLYLTDGEHSD